MRLSIVLILLLISSSLFSQYEDPRFINNLDDPIPSFTMQHLDGSESPSEELKGKVVLLYFFGTYCPPCKKLSPKLDEALGGKYDKAKFEIIAIGATDTKERLNTFLKDKRYRFSYVSDPDQDIFNLFANFTIPRMVLIDADGLIKFQVVGYNKSPFKEMCSLIDEEVGKL